MNREQFAALMEMACAPELPEETRRDLIMNLYYTARAQLRALYFVRANTDGAIRQLVQDQLDSLYGFMTENREQDGHS